MNVRSHGIGLSYCKLVAKSLGGDLILNEAVRDGCEFTLHLNLKKSDSEPQHCFKLSIICIYRMFIHYTFMLIIFPSTDSKNS